MVRVSGSRVVRPAAWLEARQIVMSASRACQSLPNLFFAPASEHAKHRVVRERKAKRICDPCPVKAECNTMGEYEDYGIWAGVNRDTKGRTTGYRACEECGELYVAIRYNHKTCSEVCKVARRYRQKKLSKRKREMARIGGVT